MKGQDLNQFATGLVWLLRKLDTNGIEVTARGPCVIASDAEGLIAATDLSAFVSDPYEPDELVTALSSALELVQQAIVHATTDPWPLRRGSRDLADAVVTWDDDKLNIGFVWPDRHTMNLGAISLKDSRGA